MNGKVRIEINPDAEEEIIIRCKRLSDDVIRLQDIIESGVHPESSEMVLTLNGKEYIVAVRDILFFEATDGLTAVNTADRIYYTEMKLYELENTLPRDFMRVSKSFILNLDAVSYMKKELTGICEVGFMNTQKHVYVSRMYYKQFREKLTEMRLKK